MKEELKRGRGRPPRNAVAATQRLEVRLTEDEKKEMSQYADKYYDGDRAAMIREAFELLRNRIVVHERRKAKGKKS